MTKMLTSAAANAMAAYIDFVYAECLGEDETFTLGAAWRETQTDFERMHVAAAIVYRADALSDRHYKIVNERGAHADPRLCIVADSLAL